MIQVCATGLSGESPVYLGDVGSHAASAGTCVGSTAVISAANIGLRAARQRPADCIPVTIQWPKPQRKEEILKSELPPTLPLMALRSTIVYPLGTIAVQMGAPENLALLRAHEEPGLIVALVVASGDHDEPIDPQRFVGRVGVAARVHERINLPGDTVQITLQGLRRIVDRGDRADRAVPDRGDPAGEGDRRPTRPSSTTSSRAWSSAAETLAELVDRIPGRGARDPEDERLRSGAVRRPRGDEHELPHLGQGRGAAAPRRRPAPALHPDAPRARSRARARHGGREAADRDQDRAAPARVLSAPAAARDPGGARRGRSRREGSDRAPQEDRRGQAARESRRRRRAARPSACACCRPASSEYQVMRTYLDWILSLPWNKRSGDEEIELKKVEEALDRRHYGLDEAKERIIEFLAVRKLRGGDPHGPILCFVGPPGTGKTSLGEAIAQRDRPRVLPHLRRRRARRGRDSRTPAHVRRRDARPAHPGAAPRAGAGIPVLMIDEIDKMSGGGPSRRSDGGHARGARPVAERRRSSITT